MKRSASQEAFLRFAQETAERLAALDADASAASVERAAGYQHGAAGVAAFLVEASRVFANDAFLESARRWLALAKELAKEGIRAADLEHSDPSLLPHAPLVGSAGIDWVDALLADRCGDAHARAAALSSLRARMREALDVHLEPGILLGHAGHAALAARAGERFADLTDEERTELAELGGAATAKALVAGSDATAELALAHGRAGALWVALSADRSPSGPAASALVDFAGMAREVAPGIVGWPERQGEDVRLDRLVSWCNGTGGVVQLLTRAVDGSRNATIRSALEAALGTLVSIRPISPTLCCGAAGQALILDVLGAARNGALRRQLDPTVRALLRHAISSAAELPVNLFSGRAGVAYAALALADPTVDRPIGFARRGS